ncbi:hypothetical protein H6P81_010619 [Aristolochia fimbriata]|uniref:Uncharacterized protein n=1 Tax=Aristolochia fimbriata TaxID=158543 RepID=A0AAV7EQG0_ARIFI|nr:hypothetical protein H6P81_010619 [Aristolochia fimbriata]
MTKKDYGREEREAQWMHVQQTLHGLQSAEESSLFSDNNSYRELSKIAEQTKRRAEVAVRSLRNSPYEMMAPLYLQVSIISQALIFVTRSRGKKEKKPRKTEKGNAPLLHLQALEQRSRVSVVLLAVPGSLALPAYKILARVRISESRGKLRPLSSLVQRDRGKFTADAFLLLFR